MVSGISLVLGLGTGVVFEIPTLSCHNEDTPLLCMWVVVKTMVPFLVLL